MAKTLLDSLAIRHVGDGKRPNMFFVSDEKSVRAIFSRKTEAVALARSIKGYVEDRIDGAVWEHGDP